jgi:hypothetical protein
MDLITQLVGTGSNLANQFCPRKQIGIDIVNWSQAVGKKRA